MNSTSLTTLRSNSRYVDLSKSASTAITRTSSKQAQGLQTILGIDETAFWFHCSRPVSGSSVIQRTLRVVTHLDRLSVNTPGQVDLLLDFWLEMETLDFEFTTALKYCSTPKTKLPISAALKLDDDLACTNTNSTSSRPWLSKKELETLLCTDKSAINQERDSIQPSITAATNQDIILHSCDVGLVILAEERRSGERFKYPIQWEIGNTSRSGKAVNESFENQIIHGNLDIWW